MAEGEGKRARRTCTVKAQGPSAAHYVGYVEDDETIEAIMKKFEAVERVQKRGGGEEGTGADAELPPMTEEQLEEVFRQTSVRSLRSMKSNQGPLRRARALLSWLTFFTDGQLWEDDSFVSGEEDLCVPWTRRAACATLTFAQRRGGVRGARGRGGGGRGRPSRRTRPQADGAPSRALQPAPPL